MKAADLGLRSTQSGMGTFACRLAALVLLCGFCGCTLILPEARLRRRVLLYEKNLSSVYDATVLKKSLTLDVLPRIEAIEDEVTSRGDNVVASLGQAKNGYKTWFTMVAFHEYELSAVRKYFFVVDERVENSPRRGLRFDCEMLLPKQTLADSLAGEQAQRIARLKSVVDNLRKDVADLGGSIDVPSEDNKALDIGAMLVRQVFDTVLLKLDSLPGLAEKLGDPAGVGFDHINFGPGKIQMVVVGDVAKIKVRLGALLPTFEDYEQVVPGENLTGTPAEVNKLPPRSAPTQIKERVGL